MTKRFARAAGCCILALLALAPASCSSPGNAPAPQASYEPEEAVAQGRFTLAFFTNKDPARNVNETACMRRLQGLLNDKGWNAELQLKPLNYGENGELQIFELIRDEAAAGSACDGYYVTSADASRLFEAGLTRDLGEMVAKEAPVLHARYKGFFAGTVDGLPAVVQTRPKGTMTVLYVRTDAAKDTKVETLSDALALLERSGSEIKLGAMLLGGMGYGTLYDVWAGEQGYYPLAAYGMPGMLYAAYGDDACMPVPVENIAGFREFADRCMNLIKDGKLVDDFDMQESKDDAIAGYIGPLTSAMNTTFLYNRGRRGRDYVAFPLKGCARPALPQEEADTFYEAVVTAASGNAPNIVKLMQWVVSGPDNYILVNYGEPGLDYRIEDGRLEVLNNGKAMTPADWDPVMSTAYNVIRPVLFLDGSLDQVRVEAVSNFDELMAADAVYPPIWRIACLRGDPYYKCQAFDDIREEMRETIQARSNLAYAMLEDEAVNGREREQSWEELRSMWADTDELAGKYAGRIGELRGK